MSLGLLDPGKPLSLPGTYRLIINGHDTGKHCTLHETKRGILDIVEENVARYVKTVKSRQKLGRVASVRRYWEKNRERINARRRTKRAASPYKIREQEARWSAASRARRKAKAVAGIV